jgi:hypothetical protein
VKAQKQFTRQYGILSKSYLLRKMILLSSLQCFKTQNNKVPITNKFSGFFFTNLEHFATKKVSQKKNQGMAGYLSTFK